MLVLLLYFLASIDLLAAQNTRNEISVGVSLLDPASVGSAEQRVILTTQRDVFTLFKKLFETNNQSSIYIRSDTKAYRVNFVEVYYSLEDQNELTAQYLSFCNDSSMVTAVLPIDPNSANIAAQILQNCGKPSIVPSTISETFASNPLVYSLATPVPNQFDSILPNLRYYFNKPKIATISLNNANSLGACTIPQSKADTYSLNIVTFLVSNDNLTISDMEIDAAIVAARQAEAQVVLLCTEQRDAITFMKKIYAQKVWCPTVITAQWESDEAVDDPAMQYLLYLVNDHVSVTYQKDRWFQNFSDFHQQFNTTFGYMPEPKLGWIMFYSCGLIIEALMQAEGPSPQQLSYALRRISWPTIAGLIGFDGRTVSRLTTPLVQVINQTTKSVWPPLIAQTEIVMPTVYFTDRYYDNTIQSYEWGMIGFLIFCITLSLYLTVHTITLRDHSIIRASLPLFLIFILIGSILVYASIFTMLNHQSSLASCHLRIWFLAIGFCLMQGSLFAKSYGMWRMWTASLTSKVMLTRKDLILIVVLITGVQTAFLIIFSAAGDVQYEIQIRDELRPSRNVEVCVYNKVGVAMVALMAIWGGILIISGLVIAWGSRKITYLAYNESKILLYSNYTIAFFCLLGIIVVFEGDQATVEVGFILLSLTISLPALFSIGILFGNKLWLVYRQKTNKSKGSTNMRTMDSSRKSRLSTSGSGITSSSDSTPASDGQMVLVSAAEYHQLKRKVKKYKQAQGAKTRIKNDDLIGAQE